MKTPSLTRRGGLRVVAALALGAASLGGLAGPALAQGFNAGSNGSLGDVVIAASTNIALPPDGILHFRSLEVASGADVRFTPNARNTPVYILSQSNVVINGRLFLDGASGVGLSGGVPGPGGFAGGQPGFSQASPGGDGYGPGGGKAGLMGFCSPTGPAGGGFGDFGSGADDTHGRTYGGELLMPLTGGSGGGGSTARSAGETPVGGGGGGGALLIASNSRIDIIGGVFARGGGARTCHDGGSGGAIRLVAPRVAGSGTLDVNGGGGGGRGRVRVDTIFTGEIGFSFQPAASRFVGNNLLVFPPTIPSLNLVEVGGTGGSAGTAIPEGTIPDTIFLPFGSTTNRTVKLRARDFGRVVPVRVVLTPDSGPARQFDTTIDNTAANPAEATVDVTVPVNTKVTVHCWSL
jgi:hypothetical protein